MSEEKFRIESDLLGELQVPAEAYYGVQTQRALNNYKISNTRMCDYPEYVIAMACIKLAAASASFRSWNPLNPQRRQNRASSRLASWG